MPRQLTRGLQPRRAIGQPEADRLMMDDGVSEALPLFGIGDGHFKRAARHADALRRDPDAAALQGRKRDAIAVTLRADEVLTGDAAVLQEDLRRVAGVLPAFFLQAGDQVAR